MNVVKILNIFIFKERWIKYQVITRYLCDIVDFDTQNDCPKVAKVNYEEIK